MRTIRGRFDGHVIIPEDPAELDLKPNSQVIVHVESAPRKTKEQIDEEIRAYYQSMTDEERTEEEEWLRCVEKDLPTIWDEE